MSILFNFTTIIFVKRFIRKAKYFLGYFMVMKTNNEVTAYNTMKVSAILVVENESAHLNNAIESVLFQTYHDLEVVVVIDPSYTPEAMSNLSVYKTNSQFKLYIYKNEKGISSALNGAIIDSSGDWIIILNTNTCIEEAAIELAMNEIKLKPDTLFGICGNHIAAVDFTPNDFISDKQFIFSLLLQREELSQFNIINKKVFVKIGLYDSRFDGAQKYDIAMKAAFHFPDLSIAYFPEVVFQKESTLQYPENNIPEKIKVAQIKSEAKLRMEIRSGVFDKLVSFVILSYEKKEQTIQCIENIKSFVQIPHEIILFDNCSLPESQDYLRMHLKDKSDVFITFSDKNLGCPGGRHEAVKKAKGDYVVYLDNDIYIKEGWIEEILIRALSDKRIMAVTSKTVFPDGKIQFNGGKFRITDGFIKFSLIDYNLEETDIRATQWYLCDWVPGGSTLFKKEIIEKIDFSAGYINAFEDNDIALQIHKLGYIVVNCPIAKVCHNHIYFENKKTKTEKRYVKARYNNEGLIQSFLNFYKRNDLIIEDAYIFSLFSLNGKPYEKIKGFVNELLQEYE